MKRLPAFDKYEYYMRSVQDPESTLAFVCRAYRENFGKEPTVLGEDFSGTFLLSACWVESGEDTQAVAVDLDPEPLRYGLQKHLMGLDPEKRHRLRIYQTDVRNPLLPPADVICAFNFSYFILKERAQMVEYFRNCRRRLGKNGLFILDCFGGSETAEPNSESTNHGSFRYYWEQKTFDPVTHNSTFYIHFKRRGEPKRLRVFRYDWRMWTLPELTDCLKDAGFSKTEIYWEGTDKNGEGNGVFRKVRKTENEAAWIAYVTARA